MKPSRGLTASRSRSETLALAKGRSALSAGDAAEACLWLDRACRLAPDNAVIRLLYASSLIGTDDLRALALLEAVTAAHPAAWTAWRLLATQAHRLGAADRAACAIARLLSCSEMPADAAFRELAARLARSAGRDGWAGLSHSGVVSSSTPAELRLDGVPVQARPVQDGELLSILLPEGWRGDHTLDVLRSGRHLLGSPIDVASHTAVQGFVELATAARPKGAQAARGWAWMPACPDVSPHLRVLAADGRPMGRLVAGDETFGSTHGGGFARLRGFTVESACLQGTGIVRVVDHLGRDLQGSPLHLAAHRARARPLAPQPQAAPACATPASGPTPTDIIIPVCDGSADLRACLASLHRSGAAEYRLVIVEGASHTAARRAALAEAAAQGATVLRPECGPGRPAAINAGLRHVLSSGGQARDVVLLDPDALVPPGWLDALRQAAQTGHDIGSVTPMTDDGSLASYPAPGRATPPATQADLDTLARHVGTAAGAVIDLPAAPGGCTYISQACLAATGLFREDLFAQGGGETAEWSLRAAALGWRHVLHGAAFVSRAPARAPDPAVQDLLRHNLAMLDRLHPGYRSRREAFLASAPLQAIRRGVDLARWRAATTRAGAVLLVTHTLGGGVERHVQARARDIRRQGLRPVILRPVQQPAGADTYAACCHVAEEDAHAFPNLLFAWDAEHAGLLALLRAEKPRWIEIHHLVGHDPRAATLPEALGLPYDLVLHDFATVCPRITLCDGSKAYCGQPTDIRACEACVQANGNHLPGGRGPAALRQHTARLVAGARRVLSPTADTVERFARYASPARTAVQPWEDDLDLSGGVRPVPPRAAAAPVRVCVVGAIGTEKGYSLLLACARDAARRRLALSFTIVGHTIGDQALLDTGHAFVTGQYDESECLDLVRRARADIGLLPSVWPETWCYALSALWRGGLWPVVFDLGAQAERVLRTGKGTRLPPGLPARRINDALLALGRGAMNRLQDPEAAV